MGPDPYAIVRVLSVFGGYGGGVTPVPIPNTAVKPSSADGTTGSPSGRVGRRRIFFAYECMVSEAGADNEKGSVFLPSPSSLRVRDFTPRLAQPPPPVVGEPSSHSVFVFDLLAVTHFTFVDSQGEPTLGIDTDPGLEQDGGPFLAIIRQWD